LHRENSFTLKIKNKMKKGILITAITLMGSIAFAQKIKTADVPTVVTAEFASLYPSCKVEQWKKEKTNYEAKFEQNTTKMCVVIDPSGNLVKTTTHIAVAQLPVGVNDYVVKNYAGKKITEACKTTEANGVVKYEAEVNSTRLCFDANGTFVKAEKKKV
jgi:hypothetical protein